MIAARLSGIALFAACQLAVAKSNFWGLNPFASGSLRSLLGEKGSGIRSKTIRNSYHESGLGAGTVVNNVNLFSGQASYMLAIGSISAAGKVGFPIALSYNGNVREIMRADNEISPTSLIGMGWDLSTTPSVSVNHKGTFLIQDDVFYVSLGPDGGGQLVQNPAGKFFIANNPYVRVSYQAAPAGDPFFGQIESWTFEVPATGNKYIFGQADGVISNSERIVYHTQGAVRLSSFAKDSAKPYIYKWDLRKIEDAEGRNELLFEYQKFQDTLFSSKAFTRESHLKSIKWLDRRAGEAVRWEFILGDKSSGEFVKGDTTIPRFDMVPYETKYLSRIEQYASGTQSMQADFHHTVRGSGKYQKRFLDSVTFSHRLSPNSSAFIKSRPWKLEYAPDSLFNVLSKVTEPSGGITEFQYGSAPYGFPGGAEAAQDLQRKLKDTNKVALRFPGASALYGNRSSCNERFCFLVADSNDIGGKMHMEVIYNPGNYFDTSHTFRLQFTGTTSRPTSWRYIPSGDYFFVYDGNDTLLRTYSWNGSGWANRPDMKFNSFSNSSIGIEVYPGLNYMLVVEKSPTKSKTWVLLRQGDTAWVDVNASSCVLNNNLFYGDSVKFTTDGCMVWRSTVQVSVNGNLFAIVHDSTDIIYAYQLNREGTAFNEVSGGFRLYTGEVQHATYKNNWLKDIQDLSIGPDYILIRSDKGSGLNQQRIDVFHFDGYSIRGVDSTGWEPAGQKDLQAFQEADYFLTANQNPAKQDIRYWKKRLIGDSLYFAKTQVRNDLQITDSTHLFVKTSPVAFAIEYSRPASQQGGMPIPKIGADSNYMSYMYQVDPDTAPGFRNRSAELYNILGNVPAKFAALTFSGSDNMLTSLDYRKVNQFALCENTDLACNIRGYTVKMNRLASPSQPFLFRPMQFNLASGNTSHLHNLITNSARLGAHSLINTLDSSFWFVPYAYDGNDYADRPDSVKVVQSVIRRAGLNQSKLDVTTKFEYGKQYAEYNVFSQTPMFDSAAVKQVDSADISLGETRYEHNLDLRFNPLLGRNLRLNGTLKKSLSLDKAGNLIGAQTQHFRPDSLIALDSQWPPVVSLTQLDSVVTQDIRPNKSMMTQKISYHGYNLKNGSPRFDKRKVAGNSFLVSQTVFSDTGLVKERYAYDFSIEPADAVLETWGDSRYDSLNAMGASKVEYASSSPYLLAKDSLWRDVDERFNDDSLKAGVEPVFNLKQGWLPGSIITQRDSLNQIEETRTVKDTTDTTQGGGTSHSSLFYEGKLSLPAGVVSSSRLKNCAILSAENGSLPGMSKHDFEGRWDSAGSVFSAAQAHTGGYSIKVVDNYGPTTKVVLDSVRKEGFGFVFSAWIYAETGVTPVLTMERRNHLNTLVDVFYGNPVDGSIKRRRWQRWEVKLTHAQLIANNLFNGNPDYLRIWVGTGDPAGQPTRIVYVDDLVARPDNSTFNLTTYDYRGLPSSTTDTHYLTRYLERDFLGQASIMREERFRTYGQSSVHRLGENP